VIEFSVRFSRPVPVPDTDEGTEVVVSATVKGTTEEGHLRLALTATCQGEKVLSLAQAVVRK
jgi:acyl dehydratase